MSEERPTGHNRVKSHLTPTHTEALLRAVRPVYFAGVQNMYQILTSVYPEPRKEDSDWYENPDRAIRHALDARANIETEAGLNAALGQGATQAAVTPEQVLGADAPTWQAYLDAQEPQEPQMGPPMHTPPLHMSEAEIMAEANHGIAQFDQYLTDGIVPQMPQEHIDA